jgi:ribosome-associated protein
MARALREPPEERRRPAILARPFAEEALLEARTTPPTPSTAADPSALAHELVDVLVDRQAADVVLLDLTELNAFADYFVIATVDNIRQARAVLDALAAALRERGGKLQAEGDPESGWVMADAGQGVFVHLFSEETRVYYNLEGLWGRAQEVVRIQ